MALPRRTTPHRRSAMPGLSRIGEEIATRRRELNLTQQELADLSGRSRSSVQELEYGSGSVGLEALTAIAEVLGLTVALTPTGRDG